MAQLTLFLALLLLVKTLRSLVSMLAGCGHTAHGREFGQLASVWHAKPIFCGFTASVLGVYNYERGAALPGFFGRCWLSAW